MPRSATVRAMVVILALLSISKLTLSTMTRSASHARRRRSAIPQTFIASLLEGYDGKAVATAIEQLIPHGDQPRTQHPSGDRIMVKRLHVNIRVVILVGGSNTCKVVQQRVEGIAHCEADSLIAVD